MQEYSLKQPLPYPHEYEEIISKGLTNDSAIDNQDMEKSLDTDLVEKSIDEALTMEVKRRTFSADHLRRSVLIR